MIISCQVGRENFTNAFSSNPDTLNMKIPPTMVGYILEDKALSILLWRDSSSRLIVFQRPCRFPRVEPDLGYSQSIKGYQPTSPITRIPRFLKPPMLPPHRQIFLINRNKTVKLSSINTIHVNQHWLFNIALAFSFSSSL